MIILKHIFLSIIQGFTEPLPISSSGHLKIIETLLNKKYIPELDFEIIVNFGSLLAIIVIYRKEIIKIIIDFILFIKTRKKSYKTNFEYGIKIIIGTIPVALLGLFIKDFLEKNSSIKVIGLSLIVTAFFLYLIKDKIGYKNKEKISYLDAFIIGLYQVFALIPGISRSGATITGSMNQNLTRKTALNYSFMLYIPVSIASLLLSIKDIELKLLLYPYSIYIFVSFIVTYFSTKLFINIMERGKLFYFIIYCLTVGLVVFFAL